MRAAGVVLAVVAWTVCANGAAPAFASERLITAGPVDAIEAGGGWLAWLGSGRFTLWRDGRSVPWRDPFLRGLGTRRDGRSVGLFETCAARATDCELHDRRLPQGPRRMLLDPPYEPRSFAESHGTLLLTLTGPGHPRRIFIKHPGGPLRQLGDLRAGNVSLSTGAMTNFVGLNSRYRLFGAPRGRPPRWHQLASWNEAAEFDERPGTYRAIGDAQADGHYVYWAEFRARFDEHGYVEGSRRTRILRVDPRRPHEPAAFTPPRRIFRFAVTRGRLYYTDADSDAAVYEYRQPRFERTGETTPIRG